MTALLKKSPRPRRAGVRGWPLSSSRLLVTQDLVLLDIGSSAVSGVRGLRKGQQCCQDLLEVPSLRLHGALPIRTDGPDIVFL